MLVSSIAINIVVTIDSIAIGIVIAIGSIGAEISVFQLSMNWDRNNIKIDYYSAILLGLQNSDFFFPRSLFGSNLQSF